MFIAQLAFFGFFLGIVAFLLKVVLLRRLTFFDAINHLVGSIIFSIFTAVSLNPINVLDRTDVILIIVVGYFGGDLAYRLMSTREPRHEEIDRRFGR